VRKTFLLVGLPLPFFLAKVFIRQPFNFSVIEWMLLLAGIIQVLLPVMVILYLKKKYSISWIFAAFGAVMYIISMVRYPLNLLVQVNLGDYSFVMWSVLFPAVVTGIFAEGFRFLGYKYIFMPEKLTWKNGLMYGAGFGGIEIILVSLNSILTFLFLHYAPGFLPSWYKTELQMTPLYMPFVTALKQVFYLCLHMGLSIMVLQTFAKESCKYLLYAVGLHAAAHFVSVLLLQRSVFLSETSVGIFAVIGIYIVWKFRKES
jgi:uncharacterized membrane protein YhfC